MRILITFQYYMPAYKAGGPIQSIKNLARYLFSENAEVYILTSNKDLDGTNLDVAPDKWVEQEKGVQAYYNAGSISNKKDVSAILNDVSPDIIFINGIYSPVYTVYPLMYKGASRKILSVRGMLHPGALSQKALKKKVFLSAFKFWGLQRKCEYHTTTDLETDYVKNMFGSNHKVWMVPNLPNVLEYKSPLPKVKGELKLVSIGLISPMKNILHVLNALRNVKAKVTYHIYGPVKEAQYWEECKAVFPTLPHNIGVEHMGETPPEKIDGILNNYHCFILPSKSENFGHAIYEALSAGKPVITSNNTPWNGLEEANAGYNIPGEDERSITDTIEKMAKKSNEEYGEMTKAAKKYITEKYDIEKIKDQYKHMFSLVG